MEFAKGAKELGIDMLVMDDGWFGNRNDDQRALGDWWVNEKKLKGGLSHLIQRVNDLGIQFGIWYEPEMISPDSDLYRAIPTGPSAPRAGCPPSPGSSTCWT